MATEKLDLNSQCVCRHPAREHKGERGICLMATCPCYKFIAMPVVEEVKQ